MTHQPEEFRSAIANILDSKRFVINDETKIIKSFPVENPTTFRRFGTSWHKLMLRILGIIRIVFEDPSPRQTDVRENK